MHAAHHATRDAATIRPAASPLTALCMPQAAEEAKKKGEPVSDNPFDSNCITPGTLFMDRLGKHLRFFIRK